MTHARVRVPTAVPAAVICVGVALAVVGGAGADRGSEGLPRRAYLGIGVADLDAEHAAALGVRPDAVWVHALAGDSPLRDAGVRVNDAVRVLGGAPTPDVAAFAVAASALRAGRRADVVVDRTGGIVHLSVLVAEAPRERADDLRIVYDAFEVTGGVRLRAIVTSPADDAGARPAVLVVQDLVDASVEHPAVAPARELAVALARAGYVAMRFDRRGMGDSEGGSYRDVSFETARGDLECALAHLAGRRDVDPERVSIVAFGAGGVLAAALARAGEEVDALLLVGAPGRPWGEWLARRHHASLASPGDASGAGGTLEALARARTPEAIIAALPRDLAGRPGGRAEDYLRVLFSTPPAAAAASADASLALVVPGADPIVDDRDAQAIAAARRALGLTPLELLALPSVDARLARAESPEASVEQRRLGLYVFAPAAGEAITAWLDDRAGSLAERPAGRR